MKKILKFGIVAISLTPFLALAADLSSIVDAVQGQIGAIPQLLIGIAVIYFLVAVMQYASGGDDKTRGEAKTKILYGLIAIFIMVSFWTVLGILGDTIGQAPTPGSSPGYPTL